MKSATLLNCTMKEAIALGVEGAVVMQHIAYWVAYNQSNEIESQYSDKKYWAFFSQKSLASYFPCFTLSQLRRIIETLVKDGYLEKKIRMEKGIGNLPSWHRPTDKYYAIAKNSTPLAEINQGGHDNSDKTDSKDDNEKLGDPWLNSTEGLAEIDHHNNINNNLDNNKDIICKKEHITYVPKRNDDLDDNADSQQVFLPAKTKPAKTKYSAQFEQFWTAYGLNGAAKSKAQESFVKAIDRTGIAPEAIAEAAQQYHGYCLHTATPVAHATTWLNQDRFTVNYRQLYQNWKNNEARRSPAIRNNPTDSRIAIAEGIQEFFTSQER